MKFINAQQLAYILQIKKPDARIKMCNAWTKSKGIPKQEETIIGAVTVAQVKRRGSKVEDSFPVEMPIEMLEKELNLPTLQASVDDIEQNYLKRNASRKYIFWDYPEKEIEKMKADLKTVPYRLQIPPALKSLLPDAACAEILEFWRNNHELNLTLEEYENLHPKL